MDDLAKLVSDWVLQPEYSFSKDQEECMLKGLIDMEIVKGKEWIERYHSIKTLTSLKWCLIMLKGTTGMKRLEQKRTINKTKKYYETLIASK